MSELQCDFTDNGKCAAKIPMACICAQPEYQRMKLLWHQEQERHKTQGRSSESKP